MPNLLQISILGHPILRERAREVENVLDPTIQMLIDDMIYTCKETGAVGIAAPQVYKSLRILIIASKPSKRYPNAPDMEPMVVINPIDLMCSSEDMELGSEGCLSIPGIRGMVSRFRSIECSFINRNGGLEHRQFDGFLARVFQHEFDHLEGTVFLDRSDTRSLVMEVSSPAPVGVMLKK